MKKAGIVTMQGGDNYGNVLQNYAVQQLLLEQGYQPYTLNNLTKDGFPSDPCIWRAVPLAKKLRPSYISAYLRVKAGRAYGCKNDRDCRGAGLARAKKNAAEYQRAKERRQERFARCRERTLQFDSRPLSQLRHDRAQIDEYDVFICGSDQIWNPRYSTTSSVDFLQFAPEHQRIALAPSFGISQLPEERADDYRRWINSIPRLSVREDAGAAIIRDLTGREAEVLFDPTFGLSAEQWRAYAREPAQHPDGDYVFCYFLGNETNRYVRFIRDYANKNGCEIVDVCDIYDLRYYDIDPQEFVWLLDHARAVFTDSFHGMAFSINLQVPFVVFDRVERGKSMASRVQSVLSRTGLEDRQYPVEADHVAKISYQNVSEVVGQERQRIKSFLTRSLRDVGQKEHPLLAHKYHCSGCCACQNACPVDAILMTPDPEGFAYPEIDGEKCIRCLACERACPADRALPGAEETRAYYAFAKDADICRSSSSGGLFSLLAAAILRQNGAVYGAGFDDGFRICHLRIDRESDIRKLRMSKYVQSDTGLCMRDVKADLDAGIPVLFTGTPCQIAGLRQMLGRDYDNLYTQDIICHGVPSQTTWNQYLTELFAGRQIREVFFRDKTMGWNGFGMRIRFSDGPDYHQIADKDPFERGFLANLFLRPSCHQCQFKTVERCSDLTLADYWGVELVHPELRDQQGVSLVLTHTPKGEALLRQVCGSLEMGETDLGRAVKLNVAAEHSAKPHKNRMRFFSQVGQRPFAALVEDCLRLSFARRAKRFIRRGGSRVKRLLRRLLGKR